MADDAAVVTTEAGLDRTVPLCPRYARGVGSAPAAVRADFASLSRSFSVIQELNQDIRRQLANIAASQLGTALADASMPLRSDAIRATTTSVSSGPA